MKALISAFFRFWEPKLRNRGTARALLITRSNNAPPPYAKSILDIRDQHGKIYTSTKDKHMVLGLALSIAALVASLIGGYLVATKLDNSRRIK